MDYNKLVRDNIPEIIKQKGKIPFTHISNDKEYEEKLKEKLKEEVDEFLKDTNKEEMADILEAIDAIHLFKGWNTKEIADIQRRKRENRGGFKNKIILDRVE